MSLKGKSTPVAAALLKNAGTAPLVYFDNVPVYGTWGGNLEVELATRLLMPRSDGAVGVDMGCTAHLRCSPAAAMQLIDALTKALDMLSRQQSEKSELPSH